MQPVAILFKRREKFIYPTPLFCWTPTIVTRVRPTAKFLTIITHHYHTFPTRRCERTQGLNSFCCGTPGNGISQFLTGGVNLQRTALILSGIVSVKILVFQPHVLKMNVIEDRPFNACISYQAWQTWFPD